MEACLVRPSCFKFCQPPLPPSPSSFSNLDPLQLAWLEKDLAAAQANRANVPWIMVNSHFPLCEFLRRFVPLPPPPPLSPPHPLPPSDHTLVHDHPASSAKKYIGDDSEEYPTSGHEFFDCGDEGADCKTVGDFQRELSSALEPLLLKYGVEFYFAGHVHDMETVYPVYNGEVCATNYNNIQCPVHVTDGNGVFRHNPPSLLLSSAILTSSPPPRPKAASPV